MILLTVLFVTIVGLGGIDCHRVVCEYGSWTHLKENGNFSPRDIDPTLCSHLNYNFLFISSDFKLMFHSDAHLSIITFYRISLVNLFNFQY